MAAEGHSRVLVIEDDPAIRANFRDLLELDGHQVDLASSFAEALAQPNGGEVEAVVLDRRLPDGTADELFPRLREFVGDAPILIVTGYGDLEGAIAALRHGAEDYLTKPVDPEVFRSLVRRWTEAGRTRRALRETRAKLREAEQRARAAEELASIGTLTAGLAHEVGTPMNVILGHAEMIADATPDERSRERARVIGEQVRRISKIIQTLLNLARPQESLRIPVRLEEPVEQALDFLKEKLRGRGIAVERQLGRVPELRGDPDRLQQLFINLFVNASDAMPEGGTLRVGLASPTPDRVEVRVADTGAGISSESLNRIFEPFFTSKPRGAGNGLGLAVCKGIVTDHGGTIDVASEVGKGTEFCMAFPSAGSSDEA